MKRSKEAAKKRKDKKKIVKSEVKRVPGPKTISKARTTGVNVNPPAMPKKSKKTTTAKKSGVNLNPPAMPKFSKKTTKKSTTAGMNLNPPAMPKASKKTTKKSTTAGMNLNPPAMPKARKKTTTAKKSGVNLMAKNKEKSFKSAFADARKAGKKMFTFKGKKYHTKTKEELEKGTKLAKKMAYGGKVKMMGGGYMKKMAYGGKVKKKYV